MPGPLDGLVVLDLSRILAGPTCTQLLGDLGAEVIKIESLEGDDTRQWGPPFALDADGTPTDLSAYFMSSNRNKKSVAVDLTDPEVQRLLHALAARADVVIENFKPGGLRKYGLDYETLCAAYPGLVYCSISGFGQTGPNRDKPGYDLMAQGYGGVMSITGEAGGEPMKVGVGVADVVCGLYAATGILAALRHRDATGEGQHIDIALVDATMAWLVNQGLNYLTSGVSPTRAGNAHPNIVPYQVFATADGHVIVAVGNDSQYARFCDYLGQPDWATDPRYATNTARLAQRDTLVPMIAEVLATRTTAHVIAGLEARKVPVGPVNTIGQALETEQAQARGMTITMPAPHTAKGDVRLIGNPLKFSRTPVSYRSAPPTNGADTDVVLGPLKKGL
ncbi:L-carnitine dehydratase/bile acid-inducible protein F [Roseovarius sp. EC-HK134]|uniref:CaiB/BaiF CoA transferase family protein n=1 Tax=unclassified Roseovarius TaxID=2614913 RepID=UPI00125BFF76|nr:MULTISPECIES: CoA transferase [unclassified Roseovarius]VVT08809.1 L-carnitine dehydratase/bile acid-inducible protein F [Roseovarius sp. EC-HK134]VVT08934.1 L-carnitine dehydratase/bile acid-inducible protein F [Roseovarius sp. EC-SD190]